MSTAAIIVISMTNSIIIVTFLFTSSSVLESTQLIISHNIIGVLAAGISLLLHLYTGSDMPKELVPYSWVQQPCLFLQHCQGDLCRLCERPFTFINRPRHCDFCGHVFHRKDCSRREGGRALGNRVCYYCDDYRTDMRERLQNGKTIHWGPLS